MFRISHWCGPATLSILDLLSGVVGLTVSLTKLSFLLCSPVYLSPAISVSVSWLDMSWPCLVTRCVLYFPQWNMMLIFRVLGVLCVPQHYSWVHVSVYVMHTFIHMIHYKQTLYTLAMVFTFCCPAGSTASWVKPHGGGATGLKPRHGDNVWNYYIKCQLGCRRQCWVSSLSSPGCVIKTLRQQYLSVQNNCASPPPY